MPKSVGSTLHVLIHLILIITLEDTLHSLFILFFDGQRNGNWNLGGLTLTSVCLILTSYHLSNF